ncbi:MAG: bL17 family ribosomal protein [Christensenellales bacterium]
MAAYRKLGRPTDQRNAILRNLTTALLWNGKIVTTEARAKEVKRIAEKLITIAIGDYDKTATVKKKAYNDKHQAIELTVKNDMPSKLAARRQLAAYLYDLQEQKKENENRVDFKERTKDVKHPLIEKMFNEIAPKYDKRAKELGTGGGYTRMVKMGPRRGDASEMVMLTLV